MRKLKKYKVKYNPNSDTRSLDHIPTKEEVLNARKVHKMNVRSVISCLADRLKNRAVIHDYSIYETFDWYYDTVVDVLKSGNNEKFRTSDWYKYHMTKENHHLEEYQSPDSNLIDLLECIIDRKISAKERGENNIPIKISKDDVYQMFLNTCEQFEEALEVTI